MKKIKKYFFTGIATILPIAITLYIFLVIFRYADGLLGKYINAYLLKNYGYKIPGLGIIIGLALVILIGMITEHLIGGKVIPFLEANFLKLPFIKHVYSPAKQLTNFLFKKKEGETFSRMVLAQYPCEGSYSIGFMTNEEIKEIDSKLGEKVVSVLISTPPSPFSGPLILLPKSKIKVLDIPIEDAIKFVVSGGLATPHRIASDRKDAPAA